MRVIAGKARRIPLITPVGMETRPTTDRIKETLFNMIQSYLCDCNFLDLFSGSGGIGIEALSRGAKYAAFVESGQEPVRCIQENLKKTGLEEGSRILKMDVLQGIKQLEQEQKYFHLIFMDPPYNCYLEKKVLEALKNTNLVDKQTLIIFEASLETDLSYLEALGYVVEKVKKYKTNMHVFLYPDW